jgi:2-dehydro-3-deoxyphosphogluconate aldolase/(4S)-4-hydroxy-2-oxoglutarate aldolase
MTRERILERIVNCGVIAVVRLSSSSQLERVADAIREGGVDVIEFTMTTPGALRMIEETASRLGDAVLLGAGTVLDRETARACIMAGAQFVVSPILDFPSIEVCHRYDKVAIPGTFTPTELLRAWEAGADLVKVFPASCLGPRFIKDVLAPLPQVRLVPTGGVSKENAGEYIRAGAVAVAVGSELVNNKLVQQGNFAQLTENARALVEAVRSARAAGV